MHILLTNDDGVYAPGLLALAQALRKIAHVTVLAPDRNWSASGHVKTMHRPLRVTETNLADGTPARKTDGAPSDCIALAILGLVRDPIDIVVSGINPNANIGHDLTYSGTVTAAMEAALSGIPGIAISYDSPQRDRGVIDYGPAATVGTRLVQQIAEMDIPPDLLLNINIPSRSLQEMRGVQITRQGKRVYHDALVHRTDPRGRSYYWIGGDAPTGVSEPGTDFWALEQGYISITPLQLDLTASAQQEVLKGWKLRI